MEYRKRMGTECQRAFLEVAACLTQFFPQGLHVCSGIIRISSCWEFKRDRLKIKHIPRHQRRISGIWHICSLWLSLCVCHSLGSTVAWSEALFVVFGWVTVSYMLALTLVCSLLRPRINTAARVRQWSVLEVTPATWMTPTEGLVWTLPTFKASWQFMITLWFDSNPFCYCSCLSICQIWDGCRWDSITFLRSTISQGKLVKQGAQKYNYKK